jgi:REP element-mobilizing transposase RayT
MIYSVRKISRLKDYDYTAAAWYFVTVCAYHKKEIFGNVKENIMQLSNEGKIAEKYWAEIPKHFSFAETDYYMIMPNHMHGIIIINPNDSVSQCRDMACHVPTNERKFSTPIAGSLSTIIGSYKSAVTKMINEMNEKKNIIWQPRFYDRIIRNEKEFTP